MGPIHNQYVISINQSLTFELLRNSDLIHSHYHLL